MAADPLDQVSVRAFLAIPLADIFREELECLSNLLRSRIPDVRWVEILQVHLTLHFFGNIPKREIERINVSMKKVAMLFKPLELTLSGIGGFPDLERPNIVWLAVEEKTGSLLSFYRALQDEIGRLGFETEVRSFHPHATVGRVKNKVGDLRPILAKIPLAFPTPQKTAGHFVLYQSHCLPQGTRYEILETYPLSKKA